VIDFSRDLALVYQDTGTVASFNGATVYGYYDAASMDVLGADGLGIVSITKQTFRVMTSSITSVIVNQSTIIISGTTYKIIGANKVGDGLESDLLLQA
jgi:hypothetical protein